MNGYTMKAPERQHQNSQQADLKTKGTQEALYGSRYVPGMGNAALLAQIAGDGIRKGGIPGGVIQRASVGVSLVPKNDVPLLPKDVQVDTIHFGERFDTGLKTIKTHKIKPTKKQLDKHMPFINGLKDKSQEELDSIDIQTIDPIVQSRMRDMLPQVIRSKIEASGEPEEQTYNQAPTQGDHIIADAFIKKYQKDRVKGQDMNMVLDFYNKMAAEIEMDNQSAEMEDDTRVVESNALLRESKTLIDKACQKPYLIFEWNVLVKEIIKRFNMGYAKSQFSTTGTGSGGKGEKETMNNLRMLKHLPKEYLATYEDPAIFANLFDMQSADRLTNHGDANDYPIMAGQSVWEVGDFVDICRNAFMGNRDLEAPVPHLGAPGKQSLKYFREHQRVGNSPVATRFIAMLGWYYNRAYQGVGNNDRVIKKQQVLGEMEFKVWNILDAISPLKNEVQNLQEYTNQINQICGEVNSNPESVWWNPKSSALMSRAADAVSIIKNRLIQIFYDSAIVGVNNKDAKNWIESIAKLADPFTEYETQMVRLNSQFSETPKPEIWIEMMRLIMDWKGMVSTLYDLLENIYIQAMSKV